MVEWIIAIAFCVFGVAMVLQTWENARDHRREFNSINLKLNSIFEMVKGADYDRRKEKAAKFVASDPSPLGRNRFD